MNRWGARTAAWAALLGALSLAAYLGLVLLHGTQIAGVAVRVWHLALAALASAAVGMPIALRLARGPAGAARLASAALACWTSLLGLVVADIVFTRQLEATDPDALHAWRSQDAFRETDAQIWLGELLPRIRRPWSGRYALHKAGVSLEADAYGWFYEPAMLTSPTLVHEVLERRHQVYRIDADGFRATHPMQEAELFALGDSFTFATGTTQERVWTEQLAAGLGEPVYNLGVNGSSPVEQIALLEQLFASAGERFHPRRLLWMLFEGNDLEDSSSPGAPIQPHSTDTSVLRAIPEALRSVATAFVEQSFLRRLLRGELRLRAAQPAGRAADPSRVDGVRLGRLFYRSQRLGARLFLPLYVERARQPLAYVLEHANRARLETSLDQMARLARERGFAVSVLLAPTAARLHGPWFEGFPRISDAPHLLDHLEREARARGFEVVNLERALRPLAGTTLLYWRDDSHWNERGNLEVARVVAEHLHARSGAGGRRQDTSAAATPASSVSSSRPPG